MYKTLGDHIVVLLGCSSPVVLRPHEGNRYQFVGACLVAGLSNCAALLGPLPQPWMVVRTVGYGKRNIHHFYNTDTGERTEEDPRLASLAGSDWARFDREPDPDDPQVFDYFRNKKTGEVMNSDPRLLPESLVARGVPLETFTLI